MKRVLDHDPVTGTTVWHEYDSLTGETIISEVQDVQPLLERNAALRNAGTAKGKLNQIAREGLKSELGVYVGTVPQQFLVELQLRTGLNPLSKEAWPYIKAMLNDSSYNKLRVGTGKI